MNQEQIESRLKQQHQTITDQQNQIAKISVALRDLVKALQPIVDDYVEKKTKKDNPMYR